MPYSKRRSLQCTGSMICMPARAVLLVTSQGAVLLAVPYLCCFIQATNIIMTWTVGKVSIASRQAGHGSVVGVGVRLTRRVTWNSFEPTRSNRLVRTTSSTHHTRTHHAHGLTRPPTTSGPLTWHFQPTNWCPDRCETKSGPRALEGVSKLSSLEGLGYP